MKFVATALLISSTVAEFTEEKGTVGHWEKCKENEDCMLHGDYCC